MSFEEIKITVNEDASPTPLGLNIDDILGSNSDADSNSVDVQVNSIPDQDLGSVELSDGTKVEAGEVYTKAEAEGMTFEPSTDANGETDLELTIREGVEESSSTGTILSTEEILEKELEILSDLNQDGKTGITLPRSL